MTEVATARRSRITPEREAELYEAVLDLLREVGYDSLTMDAVAARTKSSKATLYRQWGGKAELVAKSLRHHKRIDLDQIDTGSLRGDFHAMAVRESDCKMEQDTALMRGLAVVVHENPELLQAFREFIIQPETEALRSMVQRAVDRGEVRADNAARDYVIHMLIGAFAVRSLIEDEAPTQSFLASYIDAVIVPALSA
jgi:AcrR family transcriptional regulator